VPVHAAPGFLALLWVARRLWHDPEWSLQVLPFAFGLAAVPVMAMAVRRLTQSRGLGLAAAALTALNPLLAHYSVFVKQYTLDFLVTALLLWAAAVVLDDRAVPVRRFAWLATLAGAAVWWSPTSVFAGAPIMNLAAVRAWAAQRREARPIAAAAAYDALVLLGYLGLRQRTNPLVVRDFRDGFLHASSFAAVWGFTGRQGRRLLETSLPSWRATTNWAPVTASWTLPFVGLGLVWLLARRSTRPIGVVVLGFYGALLLAARVSAYPLGIDRTDIFAFPVAIALFVMALHALTDRLPRRERWRVAIGVAAALSALALPVRADYWPVNDAALIERLAAEAAPRDGVILSPNGTFLAAYYGPWPVVLAGTKARTNATDAKITRDLTLFLEPNRSPLPALDAFLESAPPRVWYVAFRTPDVADILRVLAAHHYAGRLVEMTTRGALYVASDERYFGHARADGLR
jgi:hypothetical protein